MIRQWLLDTWAADRHKWSILFVVLEFLGLFPFLLVVAAVRPVLRLPRYLVSEIDKRLGFTDKSLLDNDLAEFSGACDALADSWREFVNAIRA